MEASKLIDDSFSKRHLWIDYYNVINDLFTENRLTLIHQAKTISVGMTCIKLNGVYGVSYCEIYEHLLLLFDQGKPRTIFRDEINLVSLMEFIHSLKSISERFERRGQPEDEYAIDKVRLMPSQIDQTTFEDQLTIRFQASSSVNLEKRVELEEPVNPITQRKMRVSSKLES